MKHLIRIIAAMAALALPALAGDAAPIVYNSALTGTTGGTATDLDSLAVTTAEVGRVVSFEDSVNGVVQYRLKAGTDAENDPIIVRPDNYAASTNEVVWERLAPSFSTLGLGTIASQDANAVTITGGSAVGLGNIEGGTVYSRGSFITGANADLDTFTNGQIDFYSASGTGFASISITPGSTTNVLTPFRLPEVGGGSQIIVGSGAQTLADKTYNGGTLSGTFGGDLTITGGGVFQDGGVGGGALYVGADVTANTRTANTRKLASFAAPDYANTRNVEFFVFDSYSSSNNLLGIGGRFGGSAYAATEIDFITAPNVSTTGGTKRLSISNAGLLTVGSGGSFAFADNSGTWNGTNFGGNQAMSGNLDVTGRFTAVGDSIWAESATGLVGINESSPGAQLHIRSLTGEILRLERNGVNEWSINQSATGDLAVRDTSTAIDRIHIEQGLSTVQIGGTNADTAAMMYVGTADVDIGGAVTGSGILNVKGAGTTGSTYSIYTYDSAGAGKFYVRDDGFVGTNNTLYSSNAGTGLNIVGQAYLQNANYIGVASTYDGRFIMYNSSNANHTTLRANNTPASNITIGLPDVAGDLVVKEGDNIWSGTNDFTDQVELENQSALTDNSAMNRALVDTDRWLNSARVWTPLVTPSFSNSGTGSNATSSAGAHWISISSGTSNSGYGKAIIARGLNNAPGLSGSGILFQKPIGVSINTAIIAGGASANALRLIVGAGAGAPTAADSDPIADDGFGIEIRYDGTNTEWRVFAHDGTTFTASAWTDLYTGAGILQPQTFAVYSDGAGNITGYRGTYGADSFTTITTTGGPTTTGASGTAYVAYVATNSSTGTTATQARAYSCKIYTGD